MGSLTKTRDHYLGKSFVSKHGEVFDVVAYEDNENVTLKYEDGTTVVTKVCNIRNGNTPNPNRRTTCGVGFTGVGNYKISQNGVKTDMYIKWQAMLNRVYSDHFATLKALACYSETKVCTEWHNFQSFAEWYCLNLPESSGNTMCLEKDIFGYKVQEYSPDTCCIVPYEVNIAVQIGLGVSYSKERGTWIAAYTDSLGDKTIHRHAGAYTSKDLAIAAYCAAKDRYVAMVANKFKDNIKPHVYESLQDFNTENRQLFMKGFNEIIN